MEHPGFNKFDNEHCYHYLLVIITTATTTFRWQDFSNLVRWPATLRELHGALMAAIGDAAVSRLDRFLPQHISNTAQALGTSRVRRSPTLAGTVQVALRTRGFRPDGLATLAWSCARLGHHDAALFDMIGRQATMELLQGPHSTWSHAVPWM